MQAKLGFSRPQTDSFAGQIGGEEIRASDPMEDYPERSRFDDDQIAYNGNEEFEQPPEQEFEEFEQQREQQSNHNLDNEGNEFRDSFSHRDSAAGLVRF